MNAQTLSLNLVPDNMSRIIRTSQFDIGRIFTFTMFDGNTPFEFPDDAIVTFIVGKPDGKAAKILGTCSGSTCSFMTTEQMTSVYGSCNCEIRITSGSTNIGSSNFTMIVEKSPDMPTQNYTESEIEAIRRYLKEINEIYEKIKTSGGLPSGGEVGQVLTKGENNEVEWKDASGGVASWNDLQDKPFEIKDEKWTKVLEAKISDDNHPLYSDYYNTTDGSNYTYDHSGSSSSISDSYKIVPSFHYINFIEGEEYTVRINDKTYTCTAHTDSGYMCLGANYSEVTTSDPDFEISSLSYPFNYAPSAWGFVVVEGEKGVSPTPDGKSYEIEIKHGDEVILYRTGIANGSGNTKVATMGRYGIYLTELSGSMLLYPALKVGDRYRVTLNDTEFESVCMEVMDTDSNKKRVQLGNKDDKSFLIKVNDGTDYRQSQIQIYYWVDKDADKTATSYYINKKNFHIKIEKYTIDVTKLSSMFLDLDYISNYVINTIPSDGNQTTASGDYSHAEGNQTTASGDYSHAEGNKTTASGDYSHAEGNQTTASGDYSHAEGNQTTASRNYSHAEGWNTKATNSVAHAEGNKTTASGDYSHAEGNQTTASSSSSHAEGNSTTASGANSHAEGYKTIASGAASHAEGGSNVTASGDCCHAEGGATKASNYCDHAEGEESEANGGASHAEGGGTIASGMYSHAEGQGTIAMAVASHVVGKYNIEDKGYQYVEIVGNGTRNIRSNARTLDYNGNEVLSGALTTKEIITRLYDGALLKVDGNKRFLVDQLSDNIITLSKFDVSSKKKDIIPINFAIDYDGSNKMTTLSFNEGKICGKVYKIMKASVDVIRVNGNDGQWIDSGTKVDDNIVYKSDAGSYHVANGLSRAIVTVTGYSTCTVYLRSYTESSSDYAEVGPLDASNISRGASTNVLSTKNKQSRTDYQSYTFTLPDLNAHTFEIIYSRGSSTIFANDDRGYFYIAKGRSEIYQLSEIIDICDLMPTTGTAGQILTKTDSGYEWQDAKEVIVSSSTEGSTKKFKLTVDDTGAISAQEVTG